MLQENSLDEAITKAKRQRYQVIVTTNEAIKLINRPSISLNKRLTEEMLSIPKRQRPRSVQPLLDDLIREQNKSDAVLTDIEILFDRSLAIDPIRLIESCSRSTTLIICWPGTIDSSGLTYAQPDHPEYRLYKTSELKEVIFLHTFAH